VKSANRQTGGSQAGSPERSSAAVPVSRRRRRRRLIDRPGVADSDRELHLLKAQPRREREQVMSSDNSVLSAKRENAAGSFGSPGTGWESRQRSAQFDDGERVILDAHGPESGLVIGKKGATLDAAPVPDQTAS